MAGWRNRPRLPKIIVKNTDYEKYKAEVERQIKFGYAIETEVEESVLLKAHRETLRKTIDERKSPYNVNKRKRTHADGIEYIAIMVDTQRQQQTV